MEKLTKMVYPSPYVSTCRRGYLPTCLLADVATTQIRAYVSPTAYLSPTIRHTGEFGHGKSCLVGLSL